MATFGVNSKENDVPLLSTLKPVNKELLESPSKNKQPDSAKTKKKLDTTPRSARKQREVLGTQSSGLDSAKRLLFTNSSFLNNNPSTNSTETAEIETTSSKTPPNASPLRRRSTRVSKTPAEFVQSPVASSANKVDDVSDLAQQDLDDDILTSGVVSSQSSTQPSKAVDVPVEQSEQECLFENKDKVDGGKENVDKLQIPTEDNPEEIATEEEEDEDPKVIEPMSPSRRNPTGVGLRSSPRASPRRHKGSQNNSLLKEVLAKNASEAALRQAVSPVAAKSPSSPALVSKPSSPVGLRLRTASPRKSIAVETSIENSTLVTSGANVICSADLAAKGATDNSPAPKSAIKTPKQKVQSYMLPTASSTSKVNISSDNKRQGLSPRQPHSTGKRRLPISNLSPITTASKIARIGVLADAPSSVRSKKGQDAPVFDSVANEEAVAVPAEPSRLSSVTRRLSAAKHQDSPPPPQMLLKSPRLSVVSDLPSIQEQSESGSAPSSERDANPAAQPEQSGSPGIASSVFWRELDRFVVSAKAAAIKLSPRKQNEEGSSVKGGFSSPSKRGNPASKLNSPQIASQDNLSLDGNLPQENVDNNLATPSTPSNKSVGDSSTKRSVRFGPPLKPELFLSKEPPSSPVSRGEPHVGSTRASVDSALKSALKSSRSTIASSQKTSPSPNPSHTWSAASSKKSSSFKLANQQSQQGESATSNRAKDMTPLPVMHEPLSQELPSSPTEQHISNIGWAKANVGTPVNSSSRRSSSVSRRTSMIGEVVFSSPNRGIVDEPAIELAERLSMVDDAFGSQESNNQNEGIEDICVSPSLNATPTKQTSESNKQNEATVETCAAIVDEVLAAATTSATTKVTETALKDVNFVGLRELMKTPVKPVEVSLEGLKEVLKSPKKHHHHPLTASKAEKQKILPEVKYAGLKEMVKTPMKQQGSGYEALVGFKELMNTPVDIPEAEMDGLDVLLQTPIAAEPPSATGRAKKRHSRIAIIVDDEPEENAEASDDQAPVKGVVVVPKPPVGQVGNSDAIVVVKKQRSARVKAAKESKPVVEEAPEHAFITEDAHSENIDVDDATVSASSFYGEVKPRMATRRATAKVASVDTEVKKSKAKNVVEETVKPMATRRGHRSTNAPDEEHHGVVEQKTQQKTTRRKRETKEASYKQVKEGHNEEHPEEVSVAKSRRGRKPGTISKTKKTSSKSAEDHEYGSKAIDTHDANEDKENDDAVSSKKRATHSKRTLISQEAASKETEATENDSIGVRRSKRSKR